MQNSKDKVIADKVIAIDGPSGSGKSTIAKMISDNLGLLYLDTGSMYRAIGYIIDKTNTDESEMSSFLETLKFEYAPTKDILVRINDEDLTSKIREHHVSALASKYSSLKPVREFLSKIQRQTAKSRPSILEGRDIGSVIFPNAAIKVFLTASASVRAQRRFDQLKKLSPNETYDLEQIKKDIEDRDYKDMNRDIAPLVKADDAIVIDTSEMSLDEVISTISQLYNEKKEMFI